MAVIFRFLNDNFRILTFRRPSSFVVENWRGSASQPMAPGHGINALMPSALVQGVHEMQQSRECAKIDHPLGKKLIFQGFFFLRVLLCAELYRGYCYALASTRSNHCYAKQDRR